MNVFRRIMRTHASGNVPEPARIASEALCFFQTENFDNSHEKMEKRRRSSLGVDFIEPVPLTPLGDGRSKSSIFFPVSHSPLPGVSHLCTAKSFFVPFLCKAINNH